MPPARYLNLLCVAMLLADAGLIAINAVMNAGVAMPLEVLDAQLDLKDECNLAVWFSSAQLLLVALAAGAIALCAQPATGRRWVHRTAWLGVAAIALIISADESSQMHEWLGQRYAEYRGGDDPLAASLGISATYAWLVVLSPAAILSAALMLACAARMWREHRTAALLAAAGIACWLLVLAAEFLENLASQQRIAWRGWQVTLEEGCEILGAGLLLLAFTRYLLWLLRAQPHREAPGEARPAGAQSQSPRALADRAR